MAHSFFSRLLTHFFSFFIYTCKSCIFILFLILNIGFSQIETHKGDRIVRDGVNAFYNYEYDSSLKLLSHARQEHPEHPGVHFIWAAASWTKSLAFDPVDTTQKVLESVLDEIIPIYNRLVEKYPHDPYYQLYQGSAIGLTARVTLAQKRWLATLVRAYRGFVIISDVTNQNPDLLDGRLPMGIVQYYSGMSNTILQWAVKLYGFNASKEAGLNEMILAAENSDWAWVEASGILSFLYLWVEDDPILAGKYARKVVEKYPNNFYYHVMLLEATIKIGQLDLAGKIIDNLILKTEKLTYRQKEWYLPYLEYEKALYSFQKQEYNAALNYVQNSINNYTGELDVILGFAYLLEGQIKDLTGDRSGAKKSYKACLQLNNFSSAMESAQHFLSKPFFVQ